MYGKGIADAIGGLILMVIIGAVFALIVIFYSVYKLCTDDVYEYKKPVIPEVVIKTENINGKITSDTTYVYRMK